MFVGVQFKQTEKEFVFTAVYAYLSKTGVWKLFFKVLISGL